jgi:Tfp pilus assembly pilus retraction ATPase PilT
MFFAVDSDGDTVVFSGGLSLCLDQDGDVIGEMTDESEIQLLSQMLSRVGGS